MKGLRKILDIPPTIIDRSNTDDIVIQKSNDILKTEKSTTTIKRLTETLRQRRLTLLGHIIRADPGDPMRRITFQPTVRLEEFDNGKNGLGTPGKIGSI